MESWEQDSYSERVSEEYTILSFLLRKDTEEEVLEMKFLAS
jgi:hypothetical protein